MGMRRTVIKSHHSLAVTDESHETGAMVLWKELDIELRDHSEKTVFCYIFSHSSHSDKPIAYLIHYKVNLSLK